MKLSRLELERFMLAYEDYKETDDSTLWLQVRTYLDEYIEYYFLDIIETLTNAKISQDKIEGILTILEVEIVWKKVN